MSQTNDTATSASTDVGFEGKSHVDSSFDPETGLTTIRTTTTYADGRTVINFNTPFTDEQLKVKQKTIKQQQFFWRHLVFIILSLGFIIPNVATAVDSEEDDCKPAALTPQQLRNASAPRIFGPAPTHIPQAASLSAPVCDNVGLFTDEELASVGVVPSERELFLGLPQNVKKHIFGFIYDLIVTRPYAGNYAQFQLNIPYHHQLMHAVPWDFSLHLKGNCRIGNDVIVLRTLDLNKRNLLRELRENLCNTKSVKEIKQCFRTFNTTIKNTPDDFWRSLGQYGKLRTFNYLSMVRANAYKGYNGFSESLQRRRNMNHPFLTFSHPFYQSQYYLAIAQLRELNAAFDNYFPSLHGFHALLASTGLSQEAQEIYIYAIYANGGIWGARFRNQRTACMLPVDQQWFDDMLRYIRRWF